MAFKPIIIANNVRDLTTWMVQPQTSAISYCLGSETLRLGLESGLGFRVRVRVPQLIFS